MFTRRKRQPVAGKQTNSHQGAAAPLKPFARTQLLLGKEAMERLEATRVIVFGLGGVGGNAVEALARAGIGHIDVVDNDDVSLTNVNRQLIATRDVVGRAKTDVMAERIRQINPECEVTAHQCFFLPSTSESFDFSAYDYVLDAVDTLTAKLELVRCAKQAGTPVISCMGTANKLDPSLLCVADISKTSICPFARVMRKEARKRGLGHFPVVFSTEPALTPIMDDETYEPIPEGSSRRSLPGSTPFVPPAAGILMASYVVRDLLGMLPR